MAATRTTQRAGSQADRWRIRSTSNPWSEYMTISSISSSPASPRTLGDSERVVASREAIHMDEKSPYTANLCPLSVWLELAGFREDFDESIGELVETVLRSAVRQRTTEHLDGMLSEQERIDDTVQTAARRQVRGFRLRREMPGLRSGQMKLPLQIAS